MKNEPKDVNINDQLSYLTSDENDKENIASMPSAKSTEEKTPRQKKQEANEPIYLVRYE